MKVKYADIKKYVMITWFNKKTNKISFGIDVIMLDGTSFHVREDKNNLIADRRTTMKKLRELNKELKAQKMLNSDMNDERSVATGQQSENRTPTP